MPTQSIGCQEWTTSSTKFKYISTYYSNPYIKLPMIDAFANMTTL